MTAGYYSVRQNSWQPLRGVPLQLDGLKPSSLLWRCGHLGLGAAGDWWVPESAG